MSLLRTPLLCHESQNHLLLLVTAVRAAPLLGGVSSSSALLRVDFPGYCEIGRAHV